MKRATISYYNCLMYKVEGLPQAFGRVIAQMRVEQRLSQEELAEKIGSTNVYISLLERGQRQPSLNAVILIAESLKITPAELVRRVNEQLEELKRV